MTPRLPSEDPVFVLKADDLDFVDVQKVRCLQILRGLCLGYFKPNRRRVRVVASAVVHRRNKAVEIRELARNRFAQICRECRDATLTRHMVAENCYSPNTCLLVGGTKKDSN